MIAKIVSAGALLGAAGLVGAAWVKVPRERIVAGYATSLEGRSSSQRHNADLALKQIDSRRIDPGGVLSFNRCVGSFSRDEGFRKAPVSYNGQLIDDWGGGVCQASTTLYNAALLGGLTILERTHHRFCPSYVSPGRDAAVAYPSIDLKLKNPYPFPVRIHAFIEHDQIRIDLIAPQPLPHSVEVTTKLTDLTAPTTYILDSGRRGSRIRNSGKEGFNTEVWRTIGEHEQLVSRDSYPVMNRVVER